MGQVHISSINLACPRRSQPESEPPASGDSRGTARGPAPAPPGATDHSASVQREEDLRQQLQAAEAELAILRAQRVSDSAHSGLRRASLAARGQAALGLHIAFGNDRGLWDVHTSLGLLDAEPIGSDPATFEPIPFLSIPSPVVTIPTSDQLRVATVLLVWELPGYQELRGIHWSIGASAWEALRSLAFREAERLGQSGRDSWRSIQWKRVRHTPSHDAVSELFTVACYGASPVWYFWPAARRELE